MVDKRMNPLLEELLRELWEESDISEHLPVLFTLATASETIVEFGVRSGRSTKAFLAGQGWSPRQTCLFSYDIHDCSGRIDAEWTDNQTSWNFCQADTSTLSTIPECDLLFIDTLHTYNQVVAEIQHASRVRKWIVLHDTELFGINGEQGQVGILPAIDQFLERNPEWKLLKHYRHNCGLMILQRT
jgi:hypothetical protein